MDPFMDKIIPTVEWKHGVKHTFWKSFFTPCLLQIRRVTLC